MESQDFELREQDARGFGSLVHRVMEAFGRDEATRNSISSDTIYKFLVAELKQAVEEEFGSEPPLSLLVQQLIIERRLHHVAIAQAQERAAGWEIIDVERNFEKALDGMTIRGTIDRVGHSQHGTVPQVSSAHQTCASAHNKDYMCEVFETARLMDVQDTVI